MMSYRESNPSGGYGPFAWGSTSVQGPALTRGHSPVRPEPTPVPVSMNRGQSLMMMPPGVPLASNGLGSGVARAPDQSYSLAPEVFSSHGSGREELRPARQQSGGRASQGVSNMAMPGQGSYATAAAGRSFPQTPSVPNSNELWPPAYGAQEERPRRVASPAMARRGASDVVVQMQEQMQQEQLRQEQLRQQTREQLLHQPSSHLTASHVSPPASPPREILEERRPDNSMVQDFLREVRAMRLELDIVRSSMTKAMVEQVNSLRQEMELKGSSFGKVHQEVPTNGVEAATLKEEVLALCASTTMQANDKAVALRKELAAVLAREREVVTQESTQCRAAVESLCQRVLEVQEVVAGMKTELAKAKEAKPQALVAQPPMHAVETLLKALASDLQNEQLERCARIAELQDRVSREVSDLRAQIQAKGLTVGEELSRMGAQLQEVRNSVEKAIAAEKTERRKEMKPLREAINAVQRTLEEGPEGEALSPWAMRERAKDPSGDDIGTLYDMVQEALGNVVALRRRIDEERDERGKQVNSVKYQSDQMSKQLNVMQALLRDASSSGPASPVTPRIEKAEDLWAEMTRRLEGFQAELLEQVQQRLIQREEPDDV